MHRHPTPARAAARPLPRAVPCALPRISPPPLLLAGLVAAALALACTAALAQGAASGARASLVDPAGKPVGTATFMPTTGGVELRVDVKGMAAGEHGFHFHQNGKCEPGPDAATGQTVPFGAAGGHFDPMKTGKHGRPDDTAEHVHAGDMPNLVVSADGVGRATVMNNKVTLAAGDKSIIGRSLVIHRDRDDYATNPAGNSGPRIVCGVIGGTGGAVGR